MDGNRAFSWECLLAPVRARDYARGLRGGEEAAPDTRPRGGDYRNPFEQDYHRIVTAASFRRLQDKTQVFPLERSDFVRTRLTHSLEVSSLARSLGQLMAHEVSRRGLDPTLDGRVAGELCDLLLAAGLVHDIGNPPFGHYGETTIRDWFHKHLPTLEYRGAPLTTVLTPAMQTDLLHFEGNAEALRVLSKLHFLVDEHGMNLTLPLIGCLIKYPVASPDIDPASPNICRHKLGWFQADSGLVAAVAAVTGVSGARHPLTWLLEAADDIAYRTADIEDAYKKGHFTYGEFREALGAEAPTKADALPAQVARYEEWLDELDRLLVVGRGRALEEPEFYALQNWMIRLQSDLLNGVAHAFADHYQAIMNGTHERELFDGLASEPVLTALGRIAYRYVFTSRPIIQMEIQANTIIGGLLDKFIPAAIYWRTEVEQSSLEPRLMSIVSENFRASYDIHARGRDEVWRLYLRLLLITDYVSGMTDSFALNLYRSTHGIV